MPRLIWVFAGPTVILLVLSWGGSFWDGIGSEPAVCKQFKSLCCVWGVDWKFCHKSNFASQGKPFVVEHLLSWQNYKTLNLGDGIFNLHLTLHYRFFFFHILHLTVTCKFKSCIIISILNIQVCSQDIVISALTNNVDIEMFGGK